MRYVTYVGGDDGYIRLKANTIPSDKLEMARGIISEYDNLDDYNTDVINEINNKIEAICK